MSDDLGDSREWRDSIEARVSKLEVTVQAEAGLRAKMDEDMSDLKVEFRAQRGLLQSLHLTQNEHTTLLREHSAQLREHSAQLTDIRAGQQRILVGVEAIRELLDRTLNANPE